MSARKNSLLLTMIIAAALVMTTGCSRLPIYSHFETVGANGWDRADTLHFIVPIAHDGQYKLCLDLRADSRYPYTQIVINTQFSSRRSTLATHPSLLTIDITDDDGNFLGCGSGIYQYHVSIPSAQLTKGDTLKVNVAHGMNRQLLPGISDVGITVAEEE